MSHHISRYRIGISRIPIPPRQLIAEPYYMLPGYGTRYLMQDSGAASWCGISHRSGLALLVLPITCGEAGAFHAAVAGLGWYHGWLRGASARAALSRLPIPRPPSVRCPFIFLPWLSANSQQPLLAAWGFAPRSSPGWFATAASRSAAPSPRVRLRPVLSSKYALATPVSLR